MVAIERAQIEGVDRAASRAAHPQESIPGREGAADRRREQQRHSPGQALVPGSDKVFRVLQHLGIGRATPGCLFLSSLSALIFHLASVEAHGLASSMRAVYPSAMSALRKRPDWSRPLPRPLVIPTVTTLRTLTDVCDLIERHLRWQKYVLA